MKNKKLGYFSTIIFLFKYMDKMRIQYFLFYIGWLFQTIVTIITPIIFGLMINQVVYYNDLNMFLKIGAVFFYITLFGVVLYYLIYEMYGIIWNKYNRNFRIEMFSKLQNLTAIEMDQIEYGDTINMIQFWSIEAVNFIVRNIVHNINNILLIIVCLGIILRIDVVLGLVTLVFVPISVYASFIGGKDIRKNSDLNKEKFSNYVAWLFERINSFVDLRLNSAVKSTIVEMDDKLGEIYDINAKIAVHNTVVNEIIANLKNIILVIQYFLLAYLSLEKNLTIGTITVMLSFFAILSKALSDIAQNYMDAQQRISVIDRIKTFLERDTINTNNDNLEKLEKIDTIELKNCKFGYDENLVVCDVNLKIERGEKVAIVGPSGCGKSTLLNLILGLYKPSKGSVLINGQKMDSYDIKSFYNRVGAVFQNIVLFEGTIMNNLLMGSNVSEKKVVNSCKYSALDSVIAEMDKGLKTELTIGGQNISGGQRQRIGIARAYLKSADVLIFDEATSALDKVNENVILDNLDKALNNRTCIMVTHRIENVNMCDRVIMLKDGKVIADASPDEIREQCDDYRKLFNLV